MATKHRAPRWRFVPGLRVDVGAEFVRIDGGATRRRLGGSSVVALLALDGLVDGLTERRIAGALAVEPHEVRDLLARLVALGVLESVALPATDDRQIDVYLRRTFGQPAAAAARSRLAETRVRIAAPAHLATALAAALRADGVEQVHADPGRHARFEVRIDGLAATGRSVLTLPVGVDGAEIHLGPLLGPRARCRICTPAPSALPGRLAESLAVAFAADEILTLVVGVRTSPLWRARMVVDVRSGQPRHVPVASDPACPSCGRPGFANDDARRAVLAYEQSAEAVPFAVEHRFAARSLGTAPARPYVLLDRWPAHPEGSGGPVWARDLAQVLVRATGARRAGEDTDLERVDRWTAQVGNLGSAQAYVLDPEDAFFAAGAYLDPVAHQFVALRRTSGPPRRRAVGRSPVTVALVGDVATATRRFGVGGLRAAWLNCGFALARLERECALRGWDAQRRPGPPAAWWTAQLDLDPDRDVVMAEVSLTPSPRRPIHRPAAEQHAAPETATVRLGTCYDVNGRPVPRAAFEHVLRAVSDTSAAGLGVLAHVAAVDGCPDGWHEPTPSGPRPTDGPDDVVVRSYLDQRGLRYPVVLVVYADLVHIVDERGPHGYAEALLAAAAVSDRLTLAAAEVGLVSGILAGLAASALTSSAGVLCGGRRVLLGVGIGSADADARHALGIEM